MPSANVTHTIKNLDGVTMNIRVRYTRRLRFRMWLARQVLHLGAWILGVGFEVDEGNDD